MKRCAWLLVVVMLAFSATALAQEDDAFKRAKALYVEGMTAFNQGRFSKAAESILAARDILRSRLKTLDAGPIKTKLEKAVRSAEFNLAIIYYKMHRPEESVHYLRHFLKAATPKERSDVPAEVMAQQSKVGVLIVRAPSDEATIWVEGRYVGQKEIELVVPPGTVRVAIKVNGKTVAHKSIEILAGTQPIWDVAALSQAAVKAVRGESSSGGQGKNQVGGSNPGGEKGAGGSPGRSKRRGLHWAYFAAAAGLTVALGAATLYTGLETLKIKSDYDEAASGSQEKQDLEDKGVRYRTATNALIGVTAALAAGAVALAVFTEWKAPAKKETASVSSWRILPTVGPKGAMLTFEWSH